jgi:hypothetical protein
MRGDSLRDFYAKTIALVGLAVVGGLGALIDYWPVTHPMPRVATALPGAEPAVPAVQADHAMAAAPAALAVESPVAVRRVTQRVTPVLMSARMASVPDVLGSSSSIGFEAPPPSFTSIAVQPVSTLHATTISLVAPETPTPAMTFAQHGSGQGSIDQGFLGDATDVAKKAGNTIKAGTMKTGASIIDGLRSVGGAVRRGLWRFVP